MRLQKERCAVLLFALFLLLTSVASAAIPSPPQEDIYLADFEEMVTEEDRQQILEIGRTLDHRFGAQVVVVTVDTLDGQDIESYANELFRAWGIGDREKNNGVLLLVAKGDRQFRIEVGDGLEEFITDGFAGEVLDGMKEDFGNEFYSTAIIGAYGRLVNKIYEGYGEEVPENVMDARDRAEEMTWMEIFLFLGLIIFLIAGMIFGVWQVITFVFVAVLMLLNLLTSGKLGIGTDVTGHTGGAGGSGDDNDDDSYDDDSSYDNDSSSDDDYGGGSSGGGGASGSW